MDTPRSPSANATGLDVLLAILVAGSLLMLDSASPLSILVPAAGLAALIARLLVRDSHSTHAH